MAEVDYISMLPIEIWHIILEYSIAAPDLFDPDYMVDQFPPWLIMNHRSSIQERYSKSESSLNTIRRVCGSWNDYLGQYAHRLVRMLDVMHGKVPLHHLKSAVRISFGPHPNLCCEACKPELFLQDGFKMEYFKLCRYILEREQSLEAQILDFGVFSYEIFEQISVPRTFPNLVTVQGNNMSISSITAIETIDSLPYLRHMYMRLHWAQERILTLRSSTLTTLYLSLMSPDASSTLFTTESLHLPALRNLHIDGINYMHFQTYAEPAWLPLLKVLGRELRTLYLPYEARCLKQTVPGEIWDICPKLECLFLCCDLPDTPPPVGHPIHTLDVRYWWITKRHSLQSYIPDWPGLHTVRIDTRWKDWIARDNGPLTDSQMEWLGSRICLQDSLGELYTEYLSRVESGRSES
jgi:hypothetical protein